MNRPCFVFPYRAADGATNMALDEAMLDTVGLDPSAAIFRTYGWTVPTLSLGYFQKISDAENDRPWGAAPIVRRSTGGGAIWHHHELTYAIAVPSDHPLARRSHDLYAAVHSAIIGLLGQRGVSARQRGLEASEKIAAPPPFLCFTDRHAEDIVALGSKIVGSAQRRRLGSVLQHGSMLLVHSAFTPELPGACDLASVTSDPRVWSIDFNKFVPEALGLQPVDCPFPTAFLERSEELVRNVYGNDVWNRKR